jgi:hypothetical protein
MSRLTDEQEKEMRADDAKYITVTWLGADRRKLLAELSAVRTERDAARKALDWIRLYIDKNSHQHFVEFTSDNPEFKAWRRDVDAQLSEIDKVGDAK